MKKGTMGSHSNPYLKLGIMMACSFVLMYAVMFTNVDRFSHIMLSSTRTYMTFLMISPMALVMLVFMWPMYMNKKINYLIIAASITAFSIFYFMLRNQTLVSDVEYMKAMIPHHSSAIMVSRHATLNDPETQRLAKSIIESQQREIDEMKALIEKLEKAK